MDRLRKLLGRERVNPEEYERVRCDVCGGKGVNQQLGAFGTSGSIHACGKCHGEGWILMKRPEK